MTLFNRLCFPPSPSSTPGQLFHETDFAEEKSRLSASLGSVQDESLIPKVLDFSISNELRSQETVSLLASLSANKLARESTWKFFQSNFDVFNYRYANSVDAEFNVITSVTLAFASDEKAREVETFFATNPISGGEMAAKQSVESIRISANWLKRDSTSLQEYLKSN